VPILSRFAPRRSGRCRRQVICGEASVAIRQQVPHLTQTCRSCARRSSGRFGHRFATAGKPKQPSARFLRASSGARSKASSGRNQISRGREFPKLFAKTSTRGRGSGRHPRLVNTTPPGDRRVEVSPFKSTQRQHQCCRQRLKVYRTIYGFGMIDWGAVDGHHAKRDCYAIAKPPKGGVRILIRRVLVAQLAVLSAGVTH
jgi:hypothetical protein